MVSPSYASIDLPSKLKTIVLDRSMVWVGLGLSRESDLADADGPPATAEFVVPPFALRPRGIGPKVEVAGPRIARGVGCGALSHRAAEAELIDIADAAVRAGQQERQVKSPAWVVSPYPRSQHPNSPSSECHMQ